MVLPLLQIFDEHTTIQTSFKGRRHLGFQIIFIFESIFLKLGTMLELGLEKRIFFFLIFFIRKLETTRNVEN
jgi:hypothetical protein